LARISPTSNQEEFNHEEGAKDFTDKLTLLQDVLAILIEAELSESITYKSLVYRGRGQLKTKLSEANEITMYG